MRTILILILSNLLIFNLFAQENDEYKSCEQDSIRIICFDKDAPPPLYVIKFRNSEYILDSKQVDSLRIQKAWLRKIKIGNPELYGDKGKNGVLIIIPKRRKEALIYESLNI